jgi:hypothetical protein
MKTILFVLAAMMMLVSGCATSKTYNSSIAITNPSEAISIPHPKHDEELGVKSITLTQGFLNDKFLAELLRNSGVFNVVVCLPEPVIGKAMVIPVKDELPMTDAGNILTQIKIPLPIEQLVNTKILVTTRSTDNVSDLSGRDIYAKDKDGKLMPIDAEKLDKDKEYREGICQQAQTLKEAVEFRAAYDKHYGFEPVITTTQIDLGTPSYSQYKKTIFQAMPETYETPLKMWNIGVMDIDTYKYISTEITGLTWWERVMKRTNVGTSLALSLTGYGAFIAAGDVAATGINAMIDKKATSRFPLSSRIELRVADMQPNFEMLATAYRNHTLKMLNRIRLLEAKLANANTADKSAPAYKPASTKVSARR